MENLTDNNNSPNNGTANNRTKSISSLNFTVVLRGPRTFSIAIESTLRERPKVPAQPYSIWAHPKLEELEYDIYLDFSEVNFKVIRRSSNETIYNVTASEFIYTENFMQYMTTLPTKYLYGLGQQRQKFLYQPGMYFIWGRGESGINE